MNLTENLKRWIARRIAIRRGQLGSQPMIDMDAVAGTLERSKIPAVLIIVLVWAVAITLLTVSSSQQRRHFDWVLGQPAPLTIYAKVPFDYIDQKGLLEKQNNARKASPVFLRRNPVRSAEIETRLSDFCNAIEQGLPISMEGADGQKVPPLSEGLRAALMRRKLGSLFFRQNVSETCRTGLLSWETKSAMDSDQPVVIIDEQKRRRQRELGTIPDPESFAQMLERDLLGASSKADGELRMVLRALIGKSGNLDKDDALTESATAEAVRKVRAERRHVEKGSPLIEKGAEYTEAVRSIFEAEEEAIRQRGNLEAKELLAQLVWSGLLLFAMFFFLFHFTPPEQRDIRKVFITGCVIIIALLMNYGSILLFLKGREFCRALEYQCLFAAVPVAFCGTLLTVLVGVRFALFSSGIVCGITAMMIMPNQSFELAIRWFAIATAVSLLVSRVSNYRAYFFRCFWAVFISTGLVTLSIFFESMMMNKGFLLHGLSMVAINSFAVSMLSLLLVFAFELILNVNTDMSLMVLCSTSHPLLERMKREAGGTMYHSLTVATLAEDAAREIGVNALRVKAAALFHDVGKLARAPYFTENNPKSAELHARHTPQFSSMIIRDHVKEGLELAKKYHLGKLIREGIATHHGNDLIRSFYAVAKKANEAGEKSAPVRESQFRYQGLPPKSKELTILSLADPCEAACRSLEVPSPEKIREVVTNIFVQRLLGGQLSRSDLSLSELARIKESFVTTLIGLHHSRVSYPDEGEKVNG